MKNLVLILFLAMFHLATSQNFLHQDGQNIVDKDGNNILLRGLGLGGWMVQEGYMLQTGAFAGPQHIIKEKIIDLIGEQKTKTFYDSYLTNGITKRDIDSLAAWGFNSIRLPMHYNLYTPAIEDETTDEITWIEKGFKMTDDVLEWCKENKIYLILDLHAAPGGQGKDANISDYDPSKPSLWESEANQKKMIALWRKLANRYKDEQWIAGYDIINEPNWGFTGENKNGCDETSNAPLRELMIATTKAIREVDNNHIIFIEGNCWGNNYKGVLPVWDNNMVLSFHKYWNYNTIESIQQMLDYRTQYNIPIWLGESGENSNVWFKDAISLVEKNNIGWAFWPMKKVDNIAGVTSVTMNPDFETIKDYWKDGGEKPSETFAFNALMQLAENYNMENVTIKPDVIDAMFRQVKTNTTIPFKKHTVPGIVYATEYDLGTNGYAYKDEDFINYKTNTGIQGPWNKGKKMRNDGVDIQLCKDDNSNGYEVFDIQDGEWLHYTVNALKGGSYDILIRYSSSIEEAIIHLENEKKHILKPLTLTNTTDKSAIYKIVTLKDIKLAKGENKIKVVFDKGGFVLNYLEFKIKK
ncbi:cellulase family glycosylhydrolase [Aureibaculum sp. A20]|uniref:Cellulase family glycosylhydrolase n=1 Tax=Aureibaculum flavum TaxID=2795986 RepID=A0ABS0WTF1_9FLAO|nr:cellulase family glycosylhydrolase [Aureibaculum flavum]MBJ2175276.1 cellulase family glycosylhydrolase [Aureibaculum flavum]